MDNLLLGSRQVGKKWGHILVDISWHRRRFSVVFYNIKCILLFYPIISQGRKTSTGTSFGLYEGWQNDSGNKILKYLQLFETYDSTMYMHLDSGVAMWHTHAVLFHECYTNTMEYQHNLYFKIVQCAIKTSDNSRNLESVQIVCFWEFSNLVIIKNICFIRDSY